MCINGYKCDNLKAFFYLEKCRYYLIYSVFRGNMCITLKEEIKTLSEVKFMTKNKFEKLYTKIQELKKLYNEGEKEKAQQSYSELKETIKNEENGFRKIWTMYEKAKENQNLYIDFNDVIWDNEVQSIIKTLRDNGIEKFTFSSTWSDAVKTAWLFTQNGCTLEGLTEINEGYEDFITGKIKKTPAYLFKLN